MWGGGWGMVQMGLAWIGFLVRAFLISMREVVIVVVAF